MNKRCATQLAKGTIGMDEREAPRASNMRLREGERNRGNGGKINRIHDASRADAGAAARRLFARPHCAVRRFVRSHQRYFFPAPHGCICGRLLPGRHKVFDFLLLVIVQLWPSTRCALLWALRPIQHGALPKHRPFELSARTHNLHHHAPSGEVVSIASARLRKPTLAVVGVATENEQ